MKKIALSALALLLVTACAKRPESIEASYISPTIYSDWSCKQLSEEQERLTHAYAQVAAQQNKARGNDIAGVILIGLPVSSLSGDNVAPQVANIKGQQQTIEQTMIRKNCSR